MNTFYIIFKEPITIEAKTKEEAVIKFAEMIDKYQDLNMFFTATTETQTDREKAELAEFFIEEFYDDIVGDDYYMTQEDVAEVAWKGVERWYSGKDDGSQFDCLMRGLEDWRKEHRNGQN